MRGREKSGRDSWRLRWGLQEGFSYSHFPCLSFSAKIIFGLHYIHLHIHVHISGTDVFLFCSKISLTLILQGIVLTPNSCPLGHKNSGWTPYQFTHSHSYCTTYPNSLLNSPAFLHFKPFRISRKFEVWRPLPKVIFNVAW